MFRSARTSRHTSARTARAARAALVAPALVAGLAVAAVAPSATSAAAETAATQQAWSRDTRVMTVEDPAIKEASGITRSTWSSDRVWINNDSGDTNRIFAVGSDGLTDAVLTLQGAKAHDWEDVASGPHHTIWVGDIGNNGGRRDSIQIISFTEPKNPTTEKVAATTYQMAYADKKWDAEALMVEPTSGQIYVVTKSKKGGAIYQAPNPLVAGKTNVMTRVASAPDRITGADFAPDGTSFVLRNYEQAFVYSAIGGTPNVVTLPHQRQGESIGFDRQGTGLLIGSEGKQQPVYELSN